MSGGFSRVNLPASIVGLEPVLWRVRGVGIAAPLLPQMQLDRSHIGACDLDAVSNSEGGRQMADAKELRAEANALMVEHRLVLDAGPKRCRCGACWPCVGWSRAEDLLAKARFLETSS